jgi:purine nucleoside phosphorylase
MSKEEIGDGAPRWTRPLRARAHDPAVLVGVIGGSGLYHLDNLTEMYVALPPRHLPP